MTRQARRARIDLLFELKYMKTEGSAQSGQVFAKKLF